MDLKSYRVKREYSYYLKGYYLADMISMHRCISDFNETSDKIEIERTGCLGCVASFAGREVKEDDTICYDPFSLLSTYSSELMYIAAHESAHIKHNDGFRGRVMRRLMIPLGIFLAMFLSYLCMPLIVLTPPITLAGYYWTRRTVETQADIATLEYISPNIVLDFIGDSGTKGILSWIFYDHATKPKFLRELKRLEKCQKENQK